MTTRRVAVVWRGDREARRAAAPQNNRFHHVFEELAAIGIHAEPAVYDEEFANEVRDQLLTVDGVLIWVDPLHEGKTRALLDPLLRDVAAGADPAASRRTGFSGGATRSADHAPRLGRAVSGTEDQNGDRVDAADDGGPRY